MEDNWTALYNHGDVPSIYLTASIKKEIPTRVEYDYRFEMETVTNNLGRNMQGGSSHGEKFLASLIIRFALARQLIPGFPLFGFDAPEESLDSNVKKNLICRCSTYFLIDTFLVYSLL